MRAGARPSDPATAPGSPACPTVQALSFSDLEGWKDDDQQAALRVFLQTSDALPGPDWAEVHAGAKPATATRPEARRFFEQAFRPVLIGEPPAKFTGYFEPEYDGSPVRTPRFAFPIYRKPPDLTQGEKWHSRAEIETASLLAGRGLELAWLSSALDVYFLMVQGSGRIRMPDNSILRVGYAGANGQPYRSLGQEMVRRGLFAPGQVSMQSIRAYIQENPDAEAGLLNFNPSYVFFRALPDLSADKGPIGTMGRSVTAMRTLAVDPAFTPLGAPVWVDKAGPAPLRSLMIAQDTGGAIKGPQRADIFFGSGQAAGEAAGAINDSGRMVVLLPKGMAGAVPGGGNH